MLTKFFFIVLLSLQIVVFSQEFGFIDYVKVKKGETSLINPWMGGLLAPVVSTGDINFDGVIDVVVYDINSGFFHGFIRSGNKYVYNRNATDHFPPIYDWFILKDYNCDGVVDLFTYGPPGSIAVYKGQNVGGKLQFTFRYPELRHGNVALYNVPTDYPAIEDLDGDGDLDILSFNVSGTRVTYYKNLRSDLGLPCDSLTFERITRCWGGFEEGFFDEEITLDACNPGSLRIDDMEGILHAGGSISVVDRNKNGLFDALIGDVEAKRMTFLTNGGTVNQAFMTAKDVNFPSYNSSVNISSNPVATVLDVNMDGWDDLLITPFSFSNTDNYLNTWYYQNTGPPLHQFQLQTKSFLNENMLDFGQNSVPALGDLDGDGKPDLIVGNSGLKRGGDTVLHRLVYIKNIGTTDTPVFQVMDSDFLLLSGLNFKNLAPDLTDMDGDGDLDLLIGLSDGTFIYFSNEGNKFNPNFIFRGRVKNNLGFDLDVGSNATPELYDFNKDGLPDLIAGNRSSSLHLYQNMGITAGLPVFQLITTSLGGINYPGAALSAEIADVTGDDKADLLLSGAGDSVVLYTNFEDNWNTIMTLQEKDFISGLKHKNSVLTSAFLSSNEKVDLISGTASGGLLYLSAVLEPVTPVRNNSIKSLKVYPNPTSENLFFELEKSLTFGYNLRVFDVTGKSIPFKSYLLEAFKVGLDISHLPNGIYFINLSLPGESYFSRFVKY